MSIYSPPRLIRLGHLLEMEIECSAQPRKVTEVLRCIQGRISPIGIIAVCPLRYPTYRCVNGGFLLATLRALFGEGSEYRFDPSTGEVGYEGVFALNQAFDRVAERACEDTLSSAAEKHALYDFVERVRDYEIPIMEVRDKVCLLEVFND